MAFYEYECPVHKVFEVQQSIKEDALKHCPKCKEEGNEVEVKRLISSTSFHLSGGGWASSGYS